MASIPMHGAGDYTAVPVEITTDLPGQPRFGNGVVDMGAYEFLGRLRNAPRVPIPAAPPRVIRTPYFPSPT